MVRPRQAGFTLIELVVVIVILGILAAVAIPQFTNVQSSAYTAVEQSACGAVRSQAVLLYASNKSAALGADIATAVNASSSGVSVTHAGACAFTAQASGNAGNTSCGAALPATLCN